MPTKGTRLSLHETQQISFKLLCDVHDFCISHSIVYSLAYGTLIGAIRHHGFIPWDDDIDLIMPRPDYERFCREWNVPGRNIVSSYHNNSYINYCKILDTLETTSINPAPYGDKIEGGVSIDIFPADGVSDSQDEYDAYIHQFYPLWRKQVRYRYSLSPLHLLVNMFPLKDFVLLSAIKTSGLGRNRIRHFNSLLRKGATRFYFGQTQHWSQLAILDDWTNCYQDINDFQYLVDVQFEDRLFKAMNGFDSFLRRIYGNYLQLPPPEQQHPSHSRTVYYWK